MSDAGMTGSQRMLAAAADARQALEPSAGRHIADFAAGCLEPDGGFRGPGPGSDLYYAVFGSGCLLALEHGFDSAHFCAYVTGFGDGEGLDFVHLCCLARCLSIVPSVDAVQRDARIVDRIRAYRTRDGGFHPQGPERAVGSAYAAFLALLAFEDLGAEMRGAETMLRGLRGLRAQDGGYGNAPGMREGTTTAASAALFVQHRLGARVDEEGIAWLRARVHARGGVSASPSAPCPDLLSTATTVFTLHVLGADLAPFAARTVEFIDQAWNEDGGFGAAPPNGASDCEYTFYALMTLGILAGGRHARM